MTTIFLENTPDYDPGAEITGLRTVTNSIAFYTEDACFRGANSFSGFFEVFDEDSFAYSDTKGQHFALVICSWHGSSQEEDFLKLQLAGPIDNLIIGYEGKVVDSIC